MPNLLKDADKIVEGARRKNYGSPKDNHTCTAELYTAYLKRRGVLTGELTAEDVCYLNILQKVSRAANGGKVRDNPLDIAGYARNIELLID